MIDTLPDDQVMANYHANQMYRLSMSCFSLCMYAVIFNILVAVAGLAMMFLERPFLVLCALLVLVIGNTIVGLICTSQKRYFNLSVDGYRYYAER